MNQRITERLLRYWLQVRGSRSMPREDEINPEELADIWDDCLLVSVALRNPEEPYKYDFLGKHLIEAYGGDITNSETCKKLISPYSKHVDEKLDEVLETKTPVTDEAEYKNSKKILIKYRQVLLPLGNEDGEVEYILGGVRWRGF